MRLGLVAVGRVKQRQCAGLCEHYQKRIVRYTRFDHVEVKDGRGRDPARAMEDEGQRLLDKLPGGCRAVLLDEHGTRRTSVGLAEWLTERERDTRDLRFVLGGSHGFSDAVRARADDTLRLSDLTLPHELARVLFLEQLYRALSIQRGSGYHHE